jgi:hypothetical protein
LFVVRETHGSLAPFSIIVRWALPVNDRIRFSSFSRQCPPYIRKIVESGARYEYVIKSELDRAVFFEVNNERPAWEGQTTVLL